MDPRQDFPSPAAHDALSAAPRPCGHDPCFLAQQDWRPGGRTTTRASHSAIIGNLHVFPKEYPHFKFTEWARKYGGIYSLKIGPGTAVVVTDITIVTELLEKRSPTSSERPTSHIVDVVTKGLHIAFARYGDTWRVLRKAAHNLFTPQAATRHLPIQRAEAAQLMHDMLQTPQEFHTHIARSANSAILSILYGIRAPRYSTPATTAFFRMMHEWMNLLEPGATPPVDLFPILKLLPGKWKRDAERVRAMQRELFLGLLEGRIGPGKGEQQSRDGGAAACFVAELLEKREHFGLDREMIAYLAGALIEGGSETTASFLTSFVLCLVVYPDARRTAQEEMDRVVGKDRMPTLEDWENLPYIRARVLETHRFRPVTPLLVPHATSAVQKCGNYTIPSGSTIFVNAWGIFHDPELFEDPDMFRPERYLLTENGTKHNVDIDPSSFKMTWAFGAGRRACPGIYVGQNFININVLNLIWAFDFAPAVDKDGLEVEVGTLAYTKGVVATPLPFCCLITPRSPEKAALIRHHLVEQTEMFEKFETGLDEEEREFARRERMGAGAGSESPG